MSHTLPLLKAARHPVALAALSLCLLHSAAAQSSPNKEEPPSPPSPETTPAKKPASERTLETVVISGSRIKRDNYNSAAPVTIIRNEDAVSAGFTSTAQVL